MLTIVLLLPFAGFLVLLALRQRMTGGIAILLTGIGLIASFWLAVNLPSVPAVFRADWATVSGLSFPVSFRLDRLAGLMLVLVHFVALLVQIYSLSYVEKTDSRSRYFSHLHLFVGAMLGIVVAGNLLVLYAFWELVGLASYLLIGYYTERPAANQAATKAFLMNRVGDMGFLMGIFLTYYYYDTLDLTTLSDTGIYAVPPTAVGLCLFMGCVGKSAQFPLLTWLPDAMEGPTPVSALLHAATMVAAGIFLLARIFPLLSPTALLVVTAVGTITTLWGGYSALFQTDIKRVLAFSTVSQLGLMVAAVGTGNVGGAMFHLLTHAFFKAGLFLGAGSVIHAVHTQNMRHMGGLRRLMPVTFVCYTVCAAALAGVPLLSGFLSKEVILAGAFLWPVRAGLSGAALVVPVLLLLSSGLTALYMTRQWRLIFFGEYRNETVLPTQVHEPGWPMRGPVVVLAVLSIAFWFSLNPFSAAGSWAINWLPEWSEAHVVWLAPVSVGLVLVSGWLGFRLREPAYTRLFVQFSVHYGFLDQVYQRVFIKPVFRLAAWLNRTDQRVVDGAVNGLGISGVVLAHMAHAFDRYGVDGVVNGAAWLAGWLGRLTRSVQNGRVQSYITAAVVGLLIVLWWIL
ncbi:NADH-quinone oxidoreductase subunit L [Spirosoma montaniterrae]|uniref:NADH-quinone oxidoreductase subunit 5 family protein n=1 Tax=Spirosoma montaniterrae TaxID=1178516 RepID=UPI001E5AAD2D|nr:NADH-quinone oxidoreductase subunit L [Spirosoma montaniterrae]